MRTRQTAVAAVIAVLLVGGVSRPARADHEAGLLLMVLVAPLVLPLGMVVVASPFMAASAVAGGGLDMAPRPTGGSLRLEGVFPFGDSALSFFRIDLGGYPASGANFGWEGRCDVMGASTGPMADALHVRWDGLGLWRLTPLKASLSLEMLGGITVWPTFGTDLGTTWTGGTLGGLRAGARAGGSGWLQLESELSWRWLFGSRSRGLDTQINLRAGASVRIRYHPPVDPARTAQIGFGVSYLGFLSVVPNAALPSTHLWVWTMSM